MNRHYLSEHGIKNELMIGFWFGAGVMLAVWVADGLNNFVRVVTRGK